MNPTKRIIDHRTSTDDPHSTRPSGLVSKQPAARREALRIHHVIGSFQMGGAERYALQLACRQAREGHDVTVVALAPGPLLEEFADQGVNLVTTAKRGRLDLTLPPRLAAVFARGRTHVVHTHNPPPLVYGSAAARSVGAVLVHTKHGINHDLPRRVWLRKVTGRLVHALVAVSEDTARKAVEQGEVKPGRLHVIQNGIELETYRPRPEARARLREMLGIRSDDRVIGSVGRLVHEKNHELLLRATAPAVREGRARLMLIGDGPEKANLLSLSRELGVDHRVHFLGTRLDTPDLLSCMDVFALSSRTEGLPLALLEAMATELPVVATRVGGVTRVLEGQDAGTLVPPGDEAAMRAAIEGLLDAPGRARQAGRRARRLVVERYGLDVVADETMVLYESLLGRSTTSTPQKSLHAAKDLAA